GRGTRRARASALGSGTEGGRRRVRGRTHGRVDRRAARARRRRVIERLIRSRRHYAWLIVAVTFVTLITTAGFRATPSVLIIPLQNELGWSRATISVAVPIGLLLFGLTAPFSAALMERFGVRRVMLI